MTTKSCVVFVAILTVPFVVTAAPDDRPVAEQDSASLEQLMERAAAVSNELNLVIARQKTIPFDLSDLRQELARAKTEVAAKTPEFVDMQKEIDKLREQFAEKTDRLPAMKDRRARMLQVQRELDRKLKSLEDKNTEDVLFENLREGVGADQIQKNEQDLRTRMQECRDLRLKLAEEKKALEKLRIEVRQKDPEIKKISLRMMELQHLLAHRINYSAAVMEKNRQIESLKKELRTLIEKCAALQKELQELYKRIADMR